MPSVIICSARRWGQWRAGLGSRVMRLCARAKRRAALVVLRPPATPVTAGLPVVRSTPFDGTYALIGSMVDAMRCPVNTINGVKFGAGHRFFGFLGVGCVIV